MMLRYLGWTESADFIINGMASTIANKIMTYDLARLREAIRVPKRDIAGRKNVEEKMQSLIPGAELVGCSGFGDAVIAHMQ
jgi:isocitrate dehydrogenase